MTQIDPAADRLQPRLKLRLAWLALLWERLWPSLWPILFVLGLFGLAALFDLLPLLPIWAHGALLALFALALGGAAWLGFRRFRLPDRSAARRRLEQASGLAHRPLTVLADRPAGGLSAEAEALWQAHRARVAAELARLKVGTPRAGLAAHDPQGLRAALLLLLVIGGVVAGGEAPERLRRALLPTVAAAPMPPPQLDVWVTPPAYTGAAPIFLTTGPAPAAGGAPGGPAAIGGTGPIPVPEGSIVLAQLQGGSGVPELVADERPAPFKEIDPGTYRVEARIVLGDHLIVRQGGATLADWQLSVIPDQPPTIELAKPPGATNRAVLRLEYKASDDYGIDKVTAIIRRADDRGGPGAGAIQLDLPLPAPNPRSAQAASYHDLTAHPWAGLPVLLRLQARDGSGQTGSTKPLKVVLPERSFSNPVAKAIIEQRKRLTLAPDDRLPVAEGLYRIGAQPEAYGGDPVVTLGLRVAERRLLDPDNANAVAEVQALLWDLALRLEEGSLSAAMRELRAAQQALEDALQRGAPDQEIQKLMDRLQQAMNQYLEQLQQQAQNAKPQQGNRQGQNVSRDDLQRMLDQARDLARSGARDAARQMLSQLQDMLENLRAQQQAGQQQDGQAGKAMQMMRDLDSLSRRQQQLLDRSFKDSQRQQMGEQPDTQPGAADQQKLRQQLGQLMRRFGEMSGDIPKSLGEAEQAMREAEQSLGQGDARGAVDPQSRALDSLQKGAQAMAESLMRQFGQQQRPGMGNDQVGQNRDPLGRGDTGTGMIDTGDVKIPEKADLQRAREILDELRRRSAERLRPKPERDYIDRLLQRF
jgi:uncharacterized protein (TIGR02302 family)